MTHVARSVGDWAEPSGAETHGYGRSLRITCRYPCPLPPKAPVPLHHSTGAASAPTQGLAFTTLSARCPWWRQGCLAKRPSPGTSAIPTALWGAVPESSRPKAPRESK